MRLLEHGYTVRTTIRSSPGPGISRDISYLTSLPRAAEKLQIFNADLDDPDSFNEAIEGCMGVFHLAFPLDFADREPEEVITKRAVDGTLGVLRACVNAKTVKRVTYIFVRRSLKDIKGFKMRGLSPKKLLDCGFKFEHGLEDMFDGAIQSCKEKGFL
ncbi:hypothetical protein NC651_006396 [Populus alba x Populus x berolinensis]|nr:hypothetical protein NC651_006396 [Populus alba x Populus x berolinensis]